MTCNGLLRRLHKSQRKYFVRDSSFDYYLEGAGICRQRGGAAEHYISRSKRYILEGCVVMEASPDYSRLARTDELSVRKYFLEESLRACKEKVQIKAFQILADISDTAKIGTGMVIFYERWIEEIDNEMKSLA